MFKLNELDLKEYNIKNYHDILEQELMKCDYEKINKFYNDLNEKEWWVFGHDNCDEDGCNLCKRQKKFYKDFSYFVDIIGTHNANIYYLKLINMISDINMKKRIELIEEENVKLKTHIECMPDGEKYFEAKEHYESLAKGNMKND